MVSIYKQLLITLESSSSYIAVAAHGSQPDGNALEVMYAHAILSHLPLGYFILGDNVYKPSKYLSPLFGSDNQINIDSDNCNFYS
jgi:hypothetical protein